MISWNWKKRINYEQLIQLFHFIIQCNLYTMELTIYICNSHKSLKIYQNLRILKYHLHNDSTTNSLLKIYILYKYFILLYPLIIQNWLYWHKKIKFQTISILESFYCDIFFSILSLKYLKNYFESNKRINYK